MFLKYSRVPRTFASSASYVPSEKKNEPGGRLLFGTGVLFLLYVLRDYCKAEYILRIA